MDRIVVIPEGGLANRMRAVASAVALGCRDVEVIWHRDNGLNAPFEAVFETSGLPFSLRNVGEWRYRACYDVPRRRNLFLPALVWKCSGYFRMHLDRDVSQDELLGMMRGSSKDLMIVTGHPFAPVGGQLLRSLFSPTQAVTAAMQEILGGRAPQVAVQIRRTDNVESISNSPLELFERAIDAELEADPDVCIFLATDDEHTKGLLESKYGGTLIINRREASRSSLAGIIDAAAEFFIMASCRKIYGSYWSSFSEVAALMGDSELLVVRR